MTFNGSYSRHFQIMFISAICFGVILLFCIHVFAHQEIKAYLYTLLIMCAFSAAGNSKSVWNIQISESGISGPVRINKKLICSEFKFEDIVKIKKGIPMMSNYYIQNKNGLKMYLHYPYLSVAQINQILKSIKSNSKI